MNHIPARLMDAGKRLYVKITEIDADDLVMELDLYLREQTAEMKKLWQRAMDAYALGDLAWLEILAAIVESKYADADTAAAGDRQNVTAFVLEELRAALAKTEERIRKCLSALERLEQEHPFKHRVLLETPQAVDEQKTKLKHQIAHYMAECRELEMQLAMMMQERVEVLH